VAIVGGCEGNSGGNQQKNKKKEYSGKDSSSIQSVERGTNNFLKGNSYIF
jgi:hypothetical protein